MIRCTFAHVDLEALKSNFRAVAEFLARRRVTRPTRRRPPGIIAVVKANAYGHGAGPVGLALEQAGATMLACADIEEGIVLREAGVRCAILVFGALSVSDLAGVFDYNLTPTISTPSAGRALQAAAAARGTCLHYHLKIDTGMNRLGFRHDNLPKTLPELLESRNLELDAVYTHFGTADDFVTPLFGDQRERFHEALRKIAALGGRPPARHAANSAAILRDARVWFDYVRPGILLYGIPPKRDRDVFQFLRPASVTRVTHMAENSRTSGRTNTGEAQFGPATGAVQARRVAEHETGLDLISLRPVMTLRSRVVAVKGVRTGESVGYGARFTASRPTDIAIVPAGYADGIDVRLAGRGSVLIAGRRAPIVGSVCMDMITVDVTGIPVETGDGVVILGRGGRDEIDVREMAQAIGTIPYEILCRIGTRIERVYNSS
jgi:alanine racemase